MPTSKYSWTKESLHSDKKENIFHLDSQTNTIELDESDQVRKSIYEIKIISYCGVRLFSRSIVYKRHKFETESHL